MHAEDRPLLIRCALIILAGLLLVVIVGQCSRPAYAQQIAGEIVYTDGDDYPALCTGREFDAYGIPVIARIRLRPLPVTIIATSCTHLFSNGFE